MTLSAEEIVLIQFSFGEIVKDERRAAAMFYERLFEIAPQLRPLFLSEPPSKNHNLMQVLALVVRHAGEIEVLLTDLRALGRRHMMYGVHLDDFEQAGKALLWTIRQTLGDRYTDSIADAWRTLYTIMLDSVLSGTLVPRIPYARDS